MLSWKFLAFSASNIDVSKRRNICICVYPKLVCGDTSERRCESLVSVVGALNAPDPAAGDGIAMSPKSEA